MDLRKLKTVFILILICVIINLTTFKPDYKNTTVNSTKTSNSPVIIIDAGHGGFDGGASTDDGYPEKNINLAVSLYLNEYLNLFGFNTILTRDADISLEDNGLTKIKQKKTSDIHNRMKIMQNTENAIFLSIHQNHYSDSKYDGMQVFFSRNQADISSRIAQSIQETTTELLQPENKRQIKECGTSVYLIYNAVKPACLVECGFLSNKDEADKLKNQLYQKQIAFCIAVGVMKYFSN